MRIMIHGTLHLMGYMDNENEERNKMITFQEKLVNEFMNKD
jgi:ssRNA-specific RNase YbeY (16S rRNA maturation enzyme)